MSKINFFALGGLDERGKNCFVLEINKNLYLFDAGITTPSFEKYGVKKIMFDYTWVQANLNRIKGLFIGIANLNNIGSLQFLNSLFKNVPIYTSNVNKIIINALFNEKSMQNLKDFTPYKINEVEPMKKFNVNDLEITPFQFAAMNPYSLGFCIKTDQGYITVIDEFIVSPESNDAYKSQIELINSITNGNNLLLITAVGNISENNGYTAPNHDPTDFFRKQIRKAPGRLVVGMFDHNLYLMTKLIDLCTELSLPMIVNSSVYVSIIRKFEELKIIKPKPPIMNIKQANEMTKGIVLVIGNRNKLFVNIDQIIEKSNKMIQPKADDKYILAIKTTPGFEFIEAKTFDKIAYLNYAWTRFPKSILEVSPSLNDHLFLLSILKPKYIIPVKGLHFNFSDYVNAASSFMNARNIISLDNGQKISFQDQKLIERKPEFLEIQEKFIGSHGLSGVEELILRERKLMSENGVVLLNMVVNKENNETNIIDLKVQCFGIAPQDDNSSEAYENMAKVIKQNVIDNFHSKKIANKDLKNNLKKIVSKYFNKSFQKTPIVLPSIIEVNLKN